MSSDTYNVTPATGRDGLVHRDLATLTCGNTRCNIPRDAQTLKRCSACHLKYYCCRACQIADWPLHRVLCSRRAADKPTEGWEDAIFRFNDIYGIFVISYGLGLVFSISELDPAFVPTPEEWRNVWSTYACAVEIKIVEVADSANGDMYSAKFYRTFPVRADTYLSVTRLRGYKNSIAKADYTVGILYVVVPYERGPVHTVTTATRTLDISEVTSPAVYMAHSRGAIKDIIQDLAA